MACTAIACKQQTLAGNQWANITAATVIPNVLDISFNCTTYKITTSFIDKLQRVQNAAAHLLTGTRKYERGLSWQMHDDLRWLVIHQRVQYKLAVTVPRCLRHRTPRYLADYCVPVSEVSGCQNLRSARCHQLSVPRVRRTTLGTRAFSMAGQHSGIHCRIICGIQLSTPNNLGGTWKRISLLDICSISALGVHVIVLCKSTFTYLLQLGSVN